jgi:hypothetical protein
MTKDTLGKQKIIGVLKFVLAVSCVYSENEENLHYKDTMSMTSVSDSHINSDS